MHRPHALLLYALLCGSQREARETNDPPLPFYQGELATTTTVMAGGTPPAKGDPRIQHYEKNAWHVTRASGSMRSSTAPNAIPTAAAESVRR